MSYGPSSLHHLSFPAILFLSWSEGFRFVPLILRIARCHCWDKKRACSWPTIGGCWKRRKRKGCAKKGLLRALILLFVSPVEYSFLLTGGNRDGEKTSYKTPEGANKPTLLPYWVYLDMNTNCEYALLRWRAIFKLIRSIFFLKPLLDFCPFVHPLQAIKTCWLPGNLSSTDKNLDSYWNFKLRLLIWIQGSARVQRRIPPCNKKTSKLLNPKC